MKTHHASHNAAQPFLPLLDNEFDDTDIASSLRLIASNEFGHEAMFEEDELEFA